MRESVGGTETASPAAVHEDEAVRQALSCLNLAEAGPAPGLIRVAEAWPILPPHIRAAILALVAAAD
jgi:hypothetical protein